VVDLLVEDEGVYPFISEPEFERAVPVLLFMFWFLLLLLLMLVPLLLPATLFPDELVFLLEEVVPEVEAAEEDDEDEEDEDDEYSEFLLELLPEELFLEEE